MAISDNIKELRKRYNLTQSELGKIAGVSDKAVSTWENGTADPRMGAIQKIADYFHISKTDVIDGFASSDTAALRIPVFGSVPAGIPMEAIEDIVDYEEIPAAWGNDKEYFALRVKGDSMYPKYIDGDTIILEKCDDAESGSDCVVYVNGYDATLKKVIKKIDCIVLQPLNPAYDPAVYDNSDPIRIVGKVVELRRKI